MNPFNIPGLNGIKTAVAGWALLITGLGELLLTIGQCLSGTLDLQVCLEKIPQLFNSVVVAAMGLGFLGIGHKIQKLKSA